MKTLAAAILLAAAAAAAEPADPLAALRFCGVRTNALDFLFTSVADPQGERPVLAFNERGGRTWFAGPGQPVGPYVLDSFTARTARVFSPSVNAQIERTLASAVLKAPDGTVRVLELGVPLALPGWMATLVREADGRMWNVREGDVLLAGGARAVVRTVGPDGVTIEVGGELRAIPALSEEERERLAAMREAAARRQEALLAQRKTEREQAELLDRMNRALNQRERPVPVEPAGGATISFATEYRYPVKWDILPLTQRKNGKLVVTPVAIPVEFETRSVGIGMGL